MKLLVREIRQDEVEQEVTQRDQFNTDAVGLAEALTRESHQNSTDGVLEPGPVRTRVKLVEARAEDADFWRQLFEPLRPHLQACEISLSGLDLAKPRLLLIEDFGTTGLKGATQAKDTGNFSDFWRRTGRSHKAGSQGGRWGLGKLVFSSSSGVRTFFGLTVQEDDPGRTPFLMGQAVLANHVLPGPPRREFAPHAFFAVDGPAGLQVPETDPAFVAAFIAATGLARGKEPGLSVVIPFVHPEITPEAMLPHVIRNWFVPILTGRLIVEIGDHVLNSATLAQIAKTFGGPEFADGKRVGFITELHAARASAPSTMLSHNWSSDGIEKAIPEGTLESLREQYKDGVMIAVRAPLMISPKTGSVEPTYIDLYLRSDPEPAPGLAFFVRGSMCIPGEARKFTGRSCFGAMIADSGPVAAFLGDAEGPAHTSWSGTAEKVTARWKNPSARLREIRRALNQLYQAVALPGDRVDPDALLNYFNIKSAASAKTVSRKPVIRKPKVPAIPRKPASYRVDKRKSGFVIGGTPHTTLPLEINVAVAYDVIDGNPINEHAKYDFELDSKDIKIEAKGASYTISGANRMKVIVKDPDFSVSVSGFDENRDLFVGDRKA